MVIVTHSYARSGKTSVSQGLRELIQPLATNECLEQMFQKIKEELVTKFAERFMEQNRKIDELEERVSCQENTINQLFLKCDYNELYSRRNFLRINGTESKKNEKIDDMWQNVKECYGFGTSAIFRRRYQSCSSNWNGAHGEKLRQESKIYHSEIQVMESAKTILRY